MFKILDHPNVPNSGEFQIIYAAALLKTCLIVKGHYLCYGEGWYFHRVIDFLYGKYEFLYKNSFFVIQICSQ